MNIKILNIIFTFIYCALSLILVCIFQRTYITKTEIRTEYIEKPVYIEKEIIKEIEVIKEIDKIVEVEVEVEPTKVYNITSAEREMIARILYREAGHSSWETQCAVVSVIFNRLKSPYWGDNIKSVLSAPKQFSTYKMINNTTPTEENYQVVDYIIKNGSTLPEYVLYFRSRHHFKYKGYVGYCKLGNLYFGYHEKDYKTWN